MRDLRGPPASRRESRGSHTAQPALPLPIPVAAVEPLVTEGVSVEGPLVNNVTLPTLK
jgi:hypothetical protein